VIKTVKARYNKGQFQPLESLDLTEGSEVLLTVATPQPLKNEDPTDETAGAWSDLLDCQALEQDIYQDRLVNTRPVVNFS
jgi:predicted DNA-binding antitoxin AbrB/MazE fold protein